MEEAAESNEAPATITYNIAGDMDVDNCSPSDIAIYTRDIEEGIEVNNC